MFKGTYSSSSSSDSSEDEDEGIMLAQLNRNKRSAPEDEVDDSDASVPSVQTEGVSSTSSDHGKGEIEGEEEDLQEPRDLEQVLLDEVVPSKLKDVWMEGKITKFVDDEDGLKKWTCAFCGEIRKGWNATKALGHMIGGANNVKGCVKIDSQWKQLYVDIIKRKKLSKQEKQDQVHKVDMSLDNKEADALKFARAEKAASRLHHFTGPMHASLPTNSVDVTTSVEEDVSTLTSGIMNSGKKTTPKNYFLKGSSTGDVFL